MTLQDLQDNFAEGWPSYINCEPGWTPLLLETHKKLLAADPDYKIHQIKQKWGGLRYYIQGNEAAVEITWDAESRSCLLCEVCGNPGKTRTKSRWVRTLCEEHHEAYIS